MLRRCMFRRYTVAGAPGVLDVCTLALRVLRARCARRYLGEEIGFYFAFLKHLSTGQSLLAPLGVLATMASASAQGAGGWEGKGEERQGRKWVGTGAGREKVKRGAELYRDGGWGGSGSGRGMG